MNKNYSSRKFVKIKGEPKIFVFDTNVIMHDYRSIYNFQDNDIYIPISVIEAIALKIPLLFSMLGHK